jgi:D-lactate dehydrogenase (cytochrome)
MDLVDLFVGSEGTLGIVTEVLVALTPLPAAAWTCWLPLASEERALEIVGHLRKAADAAWRSGGKAGIDVPAIEWFDRRSAELLREDGVDRGHGVPLAEDVEAVLLFVVEVHDETVMLPRLQEILGPDAGRLDVALPDERSKAERFGALREAVPMAVNHRVRDARLRDAGVTKVAGDFCVPWTVFPGSLRRYRDAFAARGLDAAIWGHVSDGNVHPNVIPQRAADVASGTQALLELAGWVVSVGGSPLAEHGVGRSPVKQEMLRRLRGDGGIDEMRAVKRALDPTGKLAPGVLFAA